MPMSSILMTRSDVKMPYAFSPELDRLVYVDDVPTGLRCGLLCQDCQTPLVAKNQGLKYAHHFAHAHHVESCEGLLHWTVKWILYQRILGSIAAGEELLVQWQCGSCGCFYTKNLIGNVHNASLERTVCQTIRPDITLHYWNGNEAIFVEVVDTHPPSDQVYAMAAKMGVCVVEIEVSELDDLERVRTSSPLNVSARQQSCEHDGGRCLDCGIRPCHTPNQGITWELPHKLCSQGVVAHCIPVDWDGCPCIPIQAIELDNEGDFAKDVDLWKESSYNLCGCGKAIRSNYTQCLCCWLECPLGQRLKHRHCKGCRGLITKTDRFGDLYERCFSCHRMQQVPLTRLLDR